MSLDRDGTPFLEVREGPTFVPIIPLDRPITVIGKQPDCHVVLRDKFVSKKHARIVRKADGCYVEDLKSYNSTYVRGEKLAPNVPVRLRPGDVIGICQFRFVFMPPKPESSTVLGIIAANSPTPTLYETRPEAKLRAILALSRDLVGVLDLDQVLDKILATLFHIFPQADCGYVLLKEGVSGEPLLKASRSRDDALCARTVSRTIFHHVIDRAEAVLIEDVEIEFRDCESASDARIRTLMGVPLWDQERRPVGIVQIDTRTRRRAFNHDDLELLVAVADQISVAVENARLHAIEFEHRQWERECKYAREVQRALLPKRRPRLDGFEFWDYDEPAWFVGGDYFDYNPLIGSGPTRHGDPISRWAITVGDVAGKGMPAALLMARLSSEVRVLLKTDHDPIATIEALNNELCETGTGEKFITFLLVVLDGDRRELTVLNAGHPGPIVRRADGALEIIGLDASGLPLSIKPDQDYHAARTTLGPGDVVVLYTDGVTDALNHEKERIGLAKVLETIATTTGGPKAVGTAILQAIREHAAGSPPYDDITLLCFGWGPDAHPEDERDV